MESGMDYNPTKVLATDPDSHAEASSEPTTTGSEPAQTNVMPPIPADSMDVLVSLMEDDILRSEILISRGQAPTPIIIGLEPPKQFDAARQAFAALMGMSTMARLIAAISQVTTRKSDNRTRAYSIDKPDEIGYAFAEGAGAMVQALTHGLLASYYASESGQAQNAKPSLKRSEIHGFLLQQIFGSLPQVSKDVMQRLDDILTDFVDQIKSRGVTVSASSENPTMNHCVVINYIKAIDVTGTGAALIIEAYTRVVFIKVKAEDWIHALQKPGYLKRNERINFSVELAITEMKLDKDRYAAVKPKWNKVLQIIAGESESLKPILITGGIEGYGKETSILLPVDWHVEEP